MKIYKFGYIRPTVGWRFRYQHLFVLLPASDPIDMEMLFFAGFIIIPEVVGRLDEEKKLEISIDED